MASYLTFTASTDTVFDYSTLEMIDNTVEVHENQLRVFKNGTELSEGTDYSVSSEALELTLNVPLISSDNLVIARQTRHDKCFVKFTDLSRITAFNLNLATQQIRFLTEEVADLADVMTEIGEDTPTSEYDYALYTRQFTGSTSANLDYSEIELIGNRWKLHSDQLQVRKNGVLLTLTTDYTVNPSTQIVTLVGSRLLADVLEIRRVTPTVLVVSPFTDASSLSSDRIETNFTQVKHIIEELPTWIDVELSVMRNLRFPRKISRLNYSGPGTRFQYSGLPWLPDSTVTVFVNDVEVTDYTQDEDNWWIDFPEAVEDVQIETHTTIQNFYDWSALNDLLGEVEDKNVFDDIPLEDPTTTPFATLSRFLFNDQPDPSDGTVLFLQQTGSPDLGSHGLLEFDLSNHLGETASNCSLHLFTAANGSAIGVTVYRCRRVIGANADWFTYDGTNLWAAEGGTDETLDIDTSLSAHFVCPTDIGEEIIVTEDMTELVQDALDNQSGILRLFLKADNALSVSQVLAGFEYSNEDYRPLIDGDFV